MPAQVLQEQEQMIKMQAVKIEDKVSNTGYAYFCGCNCDVNKPDVDGIVKERAEEVGKISRPSIGNR